MPIIFGLVGCVVALDQCSAGKRKDAENERQDREKKVEDRQKKVENEQKDQQIAFLNQRNTQVEYMEMVSRYATNLPGSAVLTSKPQTNEQVKGLPRIQSALAITLFEESIKKSLADPLNENDDKFKATYDVKHFDLNLNAVRALISLVDLLYIGSPGSDNQGLADRFKKERAEFLDKYVRKILQARAHSSDPTEAAAALLVYSHIFEPLSDPECKERPAKDGQHNFRETNLSLLRLNDIPSAPTSGDASGKARTRAEAFLLEGSDFRRALLKSRFSFNCSCLDKVQFDGAAVIDATFVNSFVLDDPITWKGAELARCKGFARIDWPKASFEEARLYECEFSGDGSGPKINLEGANFTAARNYPLAVTALAGSVPAVTVADPPAKYLEGVDGAKVDEKILFKNCNLSNARFTSARFRSPIFEGCQLDSATLDPASFEQAKFTSGTALHATFGPNAVSEPTLATTATVFQDMNLEGADFLTGCAVGASTFKNCKLAWAALPNTDWVTKMQAEPSSTLSFTDDSFVFVTRPATTADKAVAAPAQPTDRVVVGVLQHRNDKTQYFAGLESREIGDLLLHHKIVDKPCWEVAGVYQVQNDPPTTASATADKSSNNKLVAPSSLDDVRKYLYANRHIILP